MTLDHSNETPDFQSATAEQPLTLAKQRILKRKVLMQSDQDLKDLLESIRRRGDAVPGELAQELGCPRSTLAYNLNRLLKKRQIVRVGGGRSIRYQIAPKD